MNCTTATLLAPYAASFTRGIIAANEAALTMRPGLLKAECRAVAARGSAQKARPVRNQG